MAKQLKKLDGQLIAVFEKDYLVFGIVETVKDKQVLVLSPGIKFKPGTGFFLPFETAYISICDISEVTTFGIPFVGNSLEEFEPVAQLLTSARSS